MPLPEDALAEYRHLVYGYSLRLLGNTADAADVTQEVLVRAWRHGDGVEPARLRGWILRVTRNACLDVLRIRSAPINQPESIEEAIQLGAAHGLRPDHAAETADLRRHLDAALLRLDEPFRSIVVLREIEGLPYREIADALELPLNTLKVYLHRGRRRLREIVRASLTIDDLVQ